MVGMGCQNKFLLMLFVLAVSTPVLAGESAHREDHRFTPHHQQDEGMSCADVCSAMLETHGKAGMCTTLDDCMRAWCDDDYPERSRNFCSSDSCCSHSDCDEKNDEWCDSESLTCVVKPQFLQGTVMKTGLQLCVDPDTSSGTNYVKSFVLGLSGLKEDDGTKQNGSCDITVPIGANKGDWQCCEALKDGSNVIQWNKDNQSFNIWDPSEYYDDTPIDKHGELGFTSIEVREADGSSLVKHNVFMGSDCSLADYDDTCIFYGDQYYHQHIGYSECLHAKTGLTKVTSSCDGVSYACEKSNCSSSDGRAPVPSTADTTPCRGPAESRHPRHPLNEYCVNAQ